MSWLLELLVDAIREMCSQFIVDMMELITNMFTELLSCNLSLFEELFSVVGSLYKKCDCSYRNCNPLDDSCMAAF